MAKLPLKECANTRLAEEGVGNPREPIRGQLRKYEKKEKIKKVAPASVLMSEDEYRGDQNL